MPTPLTIRRYTPQDAMLWDDFVHTARQPALLHQRGYMDYHADRFTDHSLLFFRGAQLVALLPAEEDRATGTLHSHRGLTFGGLITAATLGAEGMLQLIANLNERLIDEGFRHVVYKPAPHIYHQQPAEEDLYALFAVCHAQLTAREASTAIDLRQPLPRLTEARRSGVRKAERAQLKEGQAEEKEWKAFWQVLEESLLQRHRVHPVHTLDEMLRLHHRFPNLIRLHTALYEGRVVAGVVTYASPTVLHTQYIAASNEGRQMGALDWLLQRVIAAAQSTPAHYFDFGKSTERGGTWLNAPLIFQKEGFGARTVCYDTYHWELL